MISFITTPKLYLVLLTFLCDFVVLEFLLVVGQSGGCVIALFIFWDLPTVLAFLGMGMIATTQGEQRDNPSVFVAHAIKRREAARHSMLQTKGDEEFGEKANRKQYQQ